MCTPLSAKNDPKKLAAAKERKQQIADFFGAVAEVPTWEKMLALGPVVLHGLACMFALNRRAKHWGAPADRIYEIKNRFLHAVVKANKHTRLETFATVRDHGYMVCCLCSHEWVGDSFCYSCHEDTGESEAEIWYIVDCGGPYRFHQPHATYLDSHEAVTVPAHDPTQPAREIPNTGLSMTEEFAAVEAAILALSPGEPAIAAE